MSSFEQKRNKQVFEIIVILKMIYIILSMISIASFFNLKKEIRSLVLMAIVISIMLITVLAYFSWIVIYTKNRMGDC